MRHAHRMNTDLNIQCSMNESKATLQGNSPRRDKISIGCHPTPLHPRMAHLINYFKAAGMFYYAAWTHRNLTDTLVTEKKKLLL